MPTTGTIWGIHAGRYGEADSLFKQGNIAIGWAEMGDLAAIPPLREAFKAKVAATYPNDKPGAIPNYAGQMFRFVHEASEGDLVVWRAKSDRLIRIGRITSAYCYDPATNSHYPNRRATTWLREINPAQVTQGALYEIGSAMSFFRAQRFADEWLGLLEIKSLPQAANDNNAEPAGDETVAYVAESIEQNTRDFILKTLEQQLKGHPFAGFVGHLLQTMGYRTRISPEGPDGGVDIVAHRDELGFEPPIVRVQVKSGSGNVGQPEVSALLGTLGQNEYGLVVTLGCFSTPAKTFARSKPTLRLIDGDELVDLVLAHYDAFDSRYKGVLPLKRVYVPDPELGGEEA